MKLLFSLVALISNVHSTILEKSTTLASQVTENGIIPSEGFSMGSLIRGFAGMLILIALCYLLSKNRIAINWKTVGFGLLAQIILAVGVLKIPFVQGVFEFIGGIFVKILDFTKAGSVFLLGDLMNADSYGYIFLFQIRITSYNVCYTKLLRPNYKAV